MKGEYPVTVGTGFSVAEVILSREKIHYTGLEKPDVMIIISEDGLNKVKNKIDDNAYVLMDDKLDDKSDPRIKSLPFVQNAGKRGAALCALNHWLKESAAMDPEALMDAVSNHKRAEVLLKAMNALE
jgi:hypothetical protein